jgi:cytochrome c-type biogenesis protein CcmH
LSGIRGPLGPLGVSIPGYAARALRGGRHTTSPGARRSLSRRLLLLLLAVAVLVAVAPSTAGAQSAGGGTSSDLTPQQEARVKALAGRLIAPCCWTQTVDVHQSEASNQIKEQIRIMIVQGKSDSEILDGFVKQYGEKILAAPPARGFNLLAYLLPLVAVLIAAGLLFVAITRWRRPVEDVPVTSPSEGPDPADDALRRRVDEELDSFDR